MLAIFRVIDIKSVVITLKFKKVTSNIMSHILVLSKSFYRSELLPEFPFFKIAGL